MKFGYAFSLTLLSFANVANAEQVTLRIMELETASERGLIQLSYANMSTQDYICTNVQLNWVTDRLSANGEVIQSIPESRLIASTEILPRRSVMQRKIFSDQFKTDCNDTMFHNGLCILRDPTFTYSCVKE